MPDSSLSLQLQGEPGRQYELQSSDNLVAWSPGPTLTLDAQGQTSLPAVQAATRFFRLRAIE